jgi:hypothetical protein
MMCAHSAMKDTVLLMKEANALQTGSVRCAMDSARRVTGSDRYTTSIVRDTTDTVPRLTDGVALMNDARRRMMSPSRHLTDAMRSATGPGRAVIWPRLSMKRAMGPMMDTMRPRTAAIADMMRAITAVTPSLGCRIGSKRITMTAFALTTGPSASMKATMPWLQRR